MDLMRTLALGALIACAPFSAMAEDAIKLAVVDFKIPTALTTTPGDPEAGRKVVVNRRLGNCLSCHEISALKKELFHGEIGPSLDGVATRWDKAQLRLILSNSKMVFPDTMMPAFYRNDGLSRVRSEFAGKTILTAQQVEDVVAYLETMK